MKLAVSLTAQCPLAISRYRATGNQLETLRHIPGTVWRGALAADIIRERKLGDNAHLDETFKAIFLSGKVRFGDLYPNDARPWPLSARLCGRNEVHGVHDLLLRSALDTELPVECEFVTSGEMCRSKLVAPAGFYRWDGQIPARHDVRVRVVAHTAISNATLRPRAGQFYTTEVVERFTQFKGDLWLEDPSLVPELTRPRSLMVGRGATRGHGLATLEVKEPFSPSSDLAPRLARVNKRFEQSQLVAFTCTLYSPCLVFDRWLCARPYLTADDVAEAVAVQPHDLDGYELKTWFSRLIAIGGWNARASMPKGDFSAIAPGSAFLFARSVPESHREAEIARLASLLDSCPKGIGERWEEGLGEVVFCDPFHYALRKS